MQGLCQSGFIGLRALQRVVLRGIAASYEGLSARRISMHVSTAMVRRSTVCVRNVRGSAAREARSLPGFFKRATATRMRERERRRASHRRFASNEYACRYRASAPLACSLHKHDARRVRRSTPATQPERNTRPSRETQRSASRRIEQVSNTASNAAASDNGVPS